MNIFYLSKDPLKCAELHCNKHCVKMIIEYAQLLSTAHRVLDNNVDVYKIAYLNHPSTIWTRKNKANYKWLSMLWVYLCNEYTYRYDKTHLTEKKLKHHLNKTPLNIPEGEFFDPPQCMPEDVKSPSTIKAYQDYYKKYKQYFAKWKKRPTPNFMEIA
jgi:murein L,D-transpeptidase YafK